MAKRSRTAGRPGQRRPLQRTGPRPAPAPARPSAASRPVGSVTPEEEARAAELEAQILAEEKAAEEARKAGSRARAPEGALYSSAPLAVRAAEEYGYVRRDVRRIAVVGGLLLAIMAVLYIVVNLTQVI
jgi:hypothetical protein